jgi:hypothetical protein
MKREDRFKSGAASATVNVIHTHDNRYALELTFWEA